MNLGVGSLGFCSFSNMSTLNKFLFAFHYLLADLLWAGGYAQAARAARAQTLTTLTNQEIKHILPVSHSQHMLPRRGKPDGATQPQSHFIPEAHLSLQLVFGVFQHSWVRQKNEHSGLCFRLSEKPDPGKFPLLTAYQALPSFQLRLPFELFGLFLNHHGNYQMVTGFVLWNSELVGFC